MFLTNLFKIKRKCLHEKITPDMEQGYCPDCGKHITNEWYITRCACCGVKMCAMNKNGEIVPQNRYCSNCGGENYIVEKLDKINFIDINYAVLLKLETDNIKIVSTTQCWQGKNSEPPRLLTLFQ